ncbi:F-box only protein 6 isoform X2 [Dendrobium catenatum]|uniref:F-box only protein 6 isoform X2 n=1 Tax=Dendrobium catenatum TaxID=906689 RepID=UPI0009F33083|nr:F-box only protein 6 isoform X2 [Dendrobium catenatum]
MKKLGAYDRFKSLRGIALVIAMIRNVAKWCSFDFDGSSIEDDYCCLDLEEKSEIVNMLEANMSPNKRSRSEKSCRILFTIPNLIGTMEQEIWKELPEDLHEAVIARLPIATLFRFRIVCQKWNSLLTSNSFSRHFSEVQLMNPWFYTIVHDGFGFDKVGGAIYDPSLKKWHHLSIPGVYPKMFLSVASAGGLVCLLDLNTRHFYICNPLIKAFKELPPSSARFCSRVVVGMVLTDNATNRSYKVVWLGCNGDYEIYDSVQNSWSRRGSLPQSVKLPLSINFKAQTVCIGSTIYFIRANPDGILRYDVSTGIWKQFIIPLPLHISDHTIAECGGKVMLVGLLSKNAATCVCIWELQKMTLLWKEVDRMPNVSCLEYYGKPVKMSCMGNQGMLMLSLRSIRSNRFITYDLFKKKWEKVPDCTLPINKRKQWIACGTAFYPFPTALP